MKFLKSYPLFSLINRYLVNLAERWFIYEICMCTLVLSLFLTIQCLVFYILVMYFNVSFVGSFFLTAYVTVVILFTLCLVLLPVQILKGWFIFITFVLGSFTLYGLFFILHWVFNVDIPVFLLIALVLVIDISLWSCYRNRIIYIIIISYLILLIDVFNCYDFIKTMVWIFENWGSSSSGNGTQNTGGSAGGPPRLPNNQWLGLMAGHSNNISAIDDSQRVPGTLEGTNTRQDTGGQFGYSQETALPEKLVPARLNRLTKIIDRNIKYLHANDPWHGNMVEARTALDEFIRLTINSSAKSGNTFVCSYRADKIQAWIRSLDSLDSKNR